MKRLTSDNPQGNYEATLNLFYIKNGETWVSGGGDPPYYPDITLDEFIRKIIKEHNLDIQCNEDDELREILAELVLDGTGTMEGVIATLYALAWAFSILRSKLSDYEDTGLKPCEVAALIRRKKK